MELKRGRVPSERIRSDGEFSHLDADRIGWPMERDFLTEMAGGGGGTTYGDNYRRDKRFGGL